MAYTKPTAPQQQQSRGAAAPRTAAPTARASAPAAPATTTSTGKRRPSHDIVAIDDEGEVIKVKNEETGAMESQRIGAIWPGKEPSSPLFIKFADGSKAKAFATKSVD